LGCEFVFVTGRGPNGRWGSGLTVAEPWAKKRVRGGIWDEVNSVYNNLAFEEAP
jgi:hypothetical protein